MNKVTSQQLVPSGGTLSVSAGIASPYICALSDAEYIPACGSLVRCTLNITADCDVLHYVIPQPKRLCLKTEYVHERFLFFPKLLTIMLRYQTPAVNTTSFNNLPTNIINICNFDFVKSKSISF